MPTNQIETRTAVEVRAAADFCLDGYAATYSSQFAMGGGIVERIQRGAFARALREKQDVRALFNHDASQILGRVKNGTLVLRDDDKGLHFKVQLDRANTIHQNVYSLVKRGDIDGCSFAFKVPNANGEKWQQGVDDRGQKCTIRTLVDVDLYDISCVTHPAYGGTQVDARNNGAGDEARRARADRLGEQIDIDNRRRLAAATAQIKGSK